jgi:hypothetical protein
MLVVACAMVWTAGTVSAFANGVPRAVARSMPASATAPENKVAWAPAGNAQVVDTGSDCGVMMSGAVHAPDLTTAQTVHTMLSDLRGKVTDVNEGGYDNLRLDYVSDPSRDGDYRITLQGVAVIDCSLSRSSQASTVLEPAAAPDQGTPVTAAGGSSWQQGLLGAFAGIAAYLAVSTVVAGALAAAGVELGVTLTSYATIGTIGCMAGVVGSTVALAVSKNTEKIGVASAAGGCILGAGIGLEVPVEAAGLAIGNAIRSLASAAPGIVGAVGGQQLVAAGEGIEMTSIGTVVGQAAEGAVAVG